MLVGNLLRTIIECNLLEIIANCHPFVREMLLEYFLRTAALNVPLILSKLYYSASTTVATIVCVCNVVSTS